MKKFLLSLIIACLSFVATKAMEEIFYMEDICSDEHDSNLRKADEHKFEEFHTSSKDESTDSDLDSLNEPEYSEVVCLQGVESTGDRWIRFKAKTSKFMITVTKFIDGPKVDTLSCNIKNRENSEVESLTQEKLLEIWNNLNEQYIAQLLLKIHDAELENESSIPASVYYHPKVCGGPMAAALLA